MDSQSAYLHRFPCIGVIEYTNVAIDSVLDVSKRLDKIHFSDEITRVPMSNVYPYKRIDSVSLSAYHFTFGRQI